MNMDVSVVRFGGFRGPFAMLLDFLGSTVRHWPSTALFLEHVAFPVDVWLATSKMRLMNTMQIAAGFVPCTIRFTAGVLEGITIPQALPRESAVVGKVVKSCCTKGAYVVVSVQGVR
jgi:hypothetical protein